MTGHSDTELECCLLSLAAAGTDNVRYFMSFVRNIGIAGEGMIVRSLAEAAVERDTCAVHAAVLQMWLGNAAHHCREAPC